MSYKVLETKIISVIHEGVEYRCKEEDVKIREVYDESPYTTTRHSKWLSKDGKELDHEIAMHIYWGNGHDNNEKNTLIRELWGL